MKHTLESFRGSKKRVPFSELDPNLQDILRASCDDSEPVAAVLFGDGYWIAEQRPGLYGLFLDRGSEWSEDLAALEKQLYQFVLAEEGGVDPDLIQRLFSLGFVTFDMGESLVWLREEENHATLILAEDGEMELVLGACERAWIRGIDTTTGDVVEDEPLDDLEDWLEEEEQMDRLADESRGFRRS